LKGKTIRCPSCGAGKEIYNPGIVTVICEYCGTAIYWDEEQVLSAGKQAILPEGFSRFYRGAAGKLKGRSFIVTGRVRYSFGKGFWDEWFVEFDNGEIGWLTEDNHEFALQKEWQHFDLPDWQDLVPGTRFMAGGIYFQVQEKGDAECIGVEGDLPVKMLTGERYRYVDASSIDGKYVLGIEFDEEQPTLFLGEWLDYTDIRLDDEGLDW
jgi:hypothetical protein